MKNLILILSLTLFSFSAIAQQKSVITGAGADNSSFNKTKKIADVTKSDINLIKKSADEWNSTISEANKTLERSKDELKEVVSRLKAKNDIFLFDEKDPGVKLYTKKDVPTCAGDKNRLIFEKVSDKSDNYRWACVEPISCDKVNGNQKNWIHDPKTGKCIKPKAEWEVGNWSSCNTSANKQTRVVKCMIISGSSRYESVSSDGHKVYDPCSKPTPISSRECADLPKE